MNARCSSHGGWTRRAPSPSPSGRGSIRQPRPSGHESNPPKCGGATSVRDPPTEVFSTSPPCLPPSLTERSLDSLPEKPVTRQASLTALRCVLRISQVHDGREGEGAAPLAHLVSTALARPSANRSLQNLVLFEPTGCPYRFDAYAMDGQRGTYPTISLSLSSQVAQRFPLTASRRFDSSRGHRGEIGEEA
jgi:hypothetical protein